MGRRTTIRFGVLAGWALLGALALARASAAQVLPAGTGSGPGSGPGQVSAQSACTGCAVVREIDDPNTGQHWILMRDPSHPGGPGVLVAEESVRDRVRLEDAVIRLHPVIRAGDQLTVEQSTAKINLKLEGVALSPAAAGAALRVRLSVSGSAVQAVALGPGRAALVAERGLWQ